MLVAYLEANRLVPPTMSGHQPCMARALNGSPHNPTAASLVPQAVRKRQAWTWAKDQAWTVFMDDKPVNRLKILELQGVLHGKDMAPAVPEATIKRPLTTLTHGAIIKTTQIIASSKP